MKTEIQGNKVVLKPTTSKDNLVIVKWRNNPTIFKQFLFRKNNDEDA